MGILTSLYAVPAPTVLAFKRKPKALHHKLRYDETGTFFHEHNIRHTGLDKAWYDLDAPLDFAVTDQSYLSCLDYFKEQIYENYDFSSLTPQAISYSLLDFTNLFLHITGFPFEACQDAPDPREPARRFLSNSFGLATLDSTLVFDEVSISKALEIIWERVVQGFEDTPEDERAQISMLTYLSSGGWDRSTLEYLFSYFRNAIVFLHDHRGSLFPGNNDQGYYIFRFSS